MKFPMFGITCKKLKVFYSVIGLNKVSMMDVLCRGKISSKMFLHNQPTSSHKTFFIGIRMRRVINNYISIAVKMLPTFPVRVFRSNSFFSHIANLFLGFFRVASAKKRILTSYSRFAHFFSRFFGMRNSLVPRLSANKSNAYFPSGFLRHLASLYHNIPLKIATVIIGITILSYPVRFVNASSYDKTTISPPVATKYFSGTIRVFNDINASTDSFRIEGGSITKSQAIATESLTINNAYTMPTADGAATQVLQTDGAGGLTWETQTGGSGSATSSLQIKDDTVEVSSPTASIDFIDYFIVTEAPAAEANVALDTTTLAGIFWDALGTHIATTTLNMSGFTISNISTFTATAGLDFLVSGDSDDYLRMLTASNIPEIWSIGSGKVRKRTDDTSFNTIEFYVNDSTTTIIGQKISTNEAYLYTSGDFIAVMGGDVDDYLKFRTVSDVPEITTVGSADLKLTSSSGEIDFDDENLSTTGSISAASYTVTGVYTFPVDAGVSGQFMKTDGAGGVSWDTAPGGGGSTVSQVKQNDVEVSSPTESMDFTRYFIVTEDPAAEANVALDTTTLVSDFATFDQSSITSSGNLDILPSGDTDDYFRFSTTANVPTITTGGSSDLTITASGGDISFGDENLATTGSLSVASFTITGKYTLPTTDGSSGQRLTTDGAGTVTWAASASADNLGNHSATQNIDLNQYSLVDVKSITGNTSMTIGPVASGPLYLKPSSGGNVTITNNTGSTRLQYNDTYDAIYASAPVTMFYHDINQVSTMTAINVIASSASINGPVNIGTTLTVSSITVNSIVGMGNLYPYGLDPILHGPLIIGSTPSDGTYLKASYNNSVGLMGYDGNYPFIYSDYTGTLIAQSDMDFYNASNIIGVSSISFLSNGYAGGSGATMNYDGVNYELDISTNVNISGSVSSQYLTVSSTSSFADDITMNADLNITGDVHINGVGLSDTTSDASGSSLVGISGIGTPTWKTQSQYNDLFGSPGRATGGAITDAGSETVNVSAGTGFIKSVDVDTATLMSFDWAASNGISVPTNEIRYIGVEYGTPPAVVSHTAQDWDYDTNFPLGSVINQAGTLYVMNDYWWVTDGMTNIVQRFQSQGTVRDDSVGGLILGTSSGNTTRQPTLTAGTVWSRLNEFDITTKDCSAGTTFYGFYRDGGTGWTRTAAKSAIDDFYDDNTGTLHALDNNKYVNFWVFVEIDTANSGQLMVIYPQTQYNTAADAEAGSIPTFPSVWYKHGILVGRIIVKEGVTTPAKVSTSFNTIFGYALAADHGNLSGLADDDHPQYWIAGTARTGNFSTTGDVDTQYLTVSSTSTFGDDVIIDGDLTINNWKTIISTNMVVDFLTVVSTASFGGDVDFNGYDLQEVTDIGTTGDADLIQLAADLATINGTAYIAGDAHLYGGANADIYIQPANSALISTQTLTGVNSGGMRYDVVRSAMNVDAGTELNLNYNTRDITTGNDFCIYEGGSAQTKVFSIEGASTHNATLAADLTTLSGDLSVDGGDIGLTADTNLIQIAANSVTVNGEMGVGMAVVSGNAIASAKPISIAINSPLYWNGYYNSGFKYIAAGYAGYINQRSDNGDMTFNLSGSGVAGAAASMTERFRIANAGAVSAGGSITGGSLLTGGNIGVSADADLLQLASNQLTVNGDQITNGKHTFSSGNLSADLPTYTANQTAQILWGYVDNFNSYDRVLDIVSPGSSQQSAIRFMTQKTGSGAGGTPTESMQITKDGTVQCDYDLVVDGGDIGLTADTDLIQIAANQVTVNGDVGIGTSSPDAQLDIEDDNPRIRLTDTKNISDWEEAEVINGIDFYSTDASGGGPGIGATIEMINKAAGTAPRPMLVFKTCTIPGSAMYNNLQIDGTTGNVTINSDSLDSDFRVESDNLNDALFVQGSDGYVGIGTLTPSTNLDVLGGFLATETADYIKFDGDATYPFEVYSTAGKAMKIRGALDMNEAGATSFQVGSSSVTTHFPLQTKDEVIMQDKITTYNSVATEGYGVPAIVDSVSLTGQSSGAGSTALTNTDAAGLYRISYYILAESIETGSETVACTFFWNDGTASRNKSSTAIAFVSGGYQQDVIYVMNGTGAALTYTVTLSEALESATYGLYITTERLN